MFSSLLEALGAGPDSTTAPASRPPPAPPAGPPSIHISNVQPCERLPHPLVLLEGQVRNMAALQLPPTDCFIEVRVGTSDATYWPIALTSGRFRALVLLPSPGRFDVQLRVNMTPLQVLVPLEYAPVETKFLVRFYYQKCVDAGDDHGFDAPPGVDNSDQAAIDRIRLNALVLQMALAEMLHDLGLPRQTFAMEFEADGLPTVRLLRSMFTLEKARAIDDQELIRLVEDDIIAAGLDTHDTYELKHAAILGCSTWNAETQKAEGHTALGGGKVGIFGSCGLHTWPRRLGEVAGCCLNNQRVDTTQLLDDSCYRKAFWANYSTGIGAFLHELGHSLGLGHSDGGIMGRGFDDMNRLLCVYQPVALDRSEELAFMYPTGDGRMALNHRVVEEAGSRDGAHWHIGSAFQLLHCPWISGRPKDSTMGPVVSWDRRFCGPVGHAECDGEQRPFGEQSTEELGAVAIEFGDYLDNVVTYTREEVKQWTDEQFRSTAQRHLFVLLPGEFITQVDVRCMAWIDGIQIHTNKRLSRWFGGYGGQLHSLKPATGCCISGFFGTRGDEHIGTLGAFSAAAPCGSQRRVTYERVPDVLISPVQHSAKNGLGRGDGDQWQFSTQDVSISAIAIKCGEFVESFHTLSLLEHATNVANQERETYAKNEHIFELLDGERIIAMEVKSGHWVDALRFETNWRLSPWFGGNGGVNSVRIATPEGMRFCGFHGSHGDRYLGSIGACFCPLPPGAAELAVAASEENPLAQSMDGRSDQDNALVGIIIAVQDGKLHTVESFATVDEFEQVVNLVHASSGRGVEVLCFPLGAGEQLLQIDTSFRLENTEDPTSATVIEGICFHTTLRCSSWLGAFHEENMRFLQTPKGYAFISVRGQREAGSIINVATEWRESVAIKPSKGFVPDGRVMVDEGAYDVRVESSSFHGIDSVFLLKKNDGDHLEFRAWRWNQFSSEPSPTTWLLPHRLLEHHVAGEDKKQALHADYVVGAMDAGGALGKSAAPAP